MRKMYEEKMSTEGHNHTTNSIKHRSKSDIPSNNKTTKQKHRVKSLSDPCLAKASNHATNGSTDVMKHHLTN